MRAILAVLLLLTLAFAGCASKGGGDDDPASTGSGTSTASGSATGTTSGSSTATSSTSATGTGAPENGVPTGAIAAVTNGTQAAFNLTGTDPDGDALNWTLDFGDGAKTEGAALPALVNHTFAVGNHTVVYNLTDGKASATYNVTLQVASGGTGTTTQDVDAEWELATNPACTDDAAPYDSVPGSFYEFTVEAGTHGKPFIATFDSGAAQDHLLFLDVAGAILLHVTTGLPADADWEVSGTVPAASVTGVFYGCLGLPSEHVVYHAG
ncbi:MAG: PKD domain-containing protein [Candidatus Thermoplasmatota archaeon]